MLQINGKHFEIVSCPGQIFEPPKKSRFFFSHFRPDILAKQKSPKVYFGPFVGGPLGNGGKNVAQTLAVDPLAALLGN